MLDLTGWCRNTLLNRVKAGTFPAPLNTSGRTRAWAEAEVVAYLDSCIRERDARVDNRQAGQQNVDALSRTLLEFRRRGHSITYSEISVGTIAVAAPVLGSDGLAVASVCAFAPELHMHGATLDRCVQAVRTAAQAISLKVAQ
ncbi:MAG: IclR family transcriptional regulator C-terminal domain-containing protein [Bordetella sp.]|nr:IclR family transcriptional regulator C-terminal domain-containing protein [Bordetella sp.]